VHAACDAQRESVEFMSDWKNLFVKEIPGHAFRSMSEKMCEMYFAAPILTRRHDNGDVTAFLHFLKNFSKRFFTKTFNT